MEIPPDLFSEDTLHINQSLSDFPSKYVEGTGPILSDSTSTLSNGVDDDDKKGR